MDSGLRRRLLLIDGHGLAYRAFYAVPRTLDGEGEGTQVVRGYLSMLLRVLGTGQYDYAMAAFDPPGPTFREELMERYKGKRLATPEDVIKQVPICQQLTEMLGIPVQVVLTYEADDILGTWVAQAQKAGMEVTILSTDKDLLQLVDTDVTMQTSNRDANGDIISYNPQKVRERFGFEPRQMIDYKTLVGDPSDNLPGVMGIGEKGAKALIAQYGSINNMLTNISVMPHDRIRKALEGHEAEVRASQTMVTIRQDVPGVELILQSGVLRGEYDRAALAERLNQLRLGDLIRRLPKVVEEPETDPVMLEIEAMLDDMGR